MEPHPRDRRQHTAGALLSIGELAGASGLSPKALRMYDESGLLPPREVDPFTGYRSYGADQVRRARLIAALRGIGMGLARIRVVCDLEPAAAASELRSWWLQEEADSASRRDAVDHLVRRLGQPSREDAMTTDSFDATGTDPTSPRPDSSAAAPKPVRTPIRTAAAAHRGLERASQQDAVLTREMPGGAQLIAVSDGFGADDGLSARILESFANALAEAVPSAAPSRRGIDAGGGLDAGAGLTALETAWAAGEQLIPAFDQSFGTANSGDGATLTAALISPDGTACIAHIGDARAVLVRGGRLDVITQDHTHVRSLVAAGRLTADEADAHPDRAVLNRALAPSAPTAPDLLVRRLAPGDLVLIASDGLHAVVDPSRVADVLTGERDTAPDQQPGSPAADRATVGADELQGIVDQLVDEALSAGGPDNVGVALAQFGMQAR